MGGHQWTISESAPKPPARPAPALTPEIASVLRSSLASNFEDTLGFDAWSAMLNTERKQTLDMILSSAVLHPQYPHFDGYNLAEDSDDVDDVNELAYAILSDTLTRLGFTNNG